MNSRSMTESTELEMGPSRSMNEVRSQQQVIGGTVIPNQQMIKQQILRELHCVPYAGHPGFNRTLEVVKTVLLLDPTFTPDVRQFILDCPVCQTEKGSHLKPAGQLVTFRITSQEVGSRCYRFCGRDASAGRM